MARLDGIAAGDGGEKQTEESGTNQAEALPEELENLNYEFLLLAYSLLSVFDVAVLFLAQDPVVRDVVQILDTPLTLIFFVDFLIRLRAAKSKRNYFFRQYGWADLVAGLPFPALKIFVCSGSSAPGV